MGNLSPGGGEGVGVLLIVVSELPEAAVFDGGLVKGFGLTTPADTGSGRSWDTVNGTFVVELGDGSTRRSGCCAVGSTCS